MSDKEFSLPEKAQLSVALKDACDTIDSLNTAIVSTSDGHVVSVFSLKTGLDYHRLSAMAASFTGLSYTMADEIKIGSVNRASIESENGLLLSQLITVKQNELALTMIFDKKVKVGMAHWALSNISNKVLELF